MLQKNPLCPPNPPRGRPAPEPGVRAEALFVSAEDFDRTGILAGVDPCESRYWWVPDLPSGVPGDAVGQAARRPRADA